MALTPGTRLGKELDIRQIAETLGVTTVLEGSVRRAASRIRVTAQLISAETGSHLWSERYDRELADLFALQDEIAGAIATALAMKLSITASHRAVRRRSGTGPRPHHLDTPVETYSEVVYHGALRSVNGGHRGA